MARILFGRVFHCRLRPVRHAFAYPVFFLRVPLSAMARAGARASSPWTAGTSSSLHSRDHGPRDGSPLEPWVRAQLARAGVRGADGEILLQAFPRVLGFVFNPISIFYCHDRAGRLQGGAVRGVQHLRRAPQLPARAPRRPAPSRRATGSRAGKVFHVSPFCEVEGHYRFRFAGDERGQLRAHRLPRRARASSSSPSSTAVPSRIAAGSARPGLPRLSLHDRWASSPASTGRRCKLWLKRVPFFSKPEPPLQETTR